MKIYRLTPGLLRKVKLRVEVSESSPGRRPLVINPNEAEATRDFARILGIYLIYARKGRLFKSSVSLPDFVTIVNPDFTLVASLVSSRNHGV